MLYEKPSAIKRKLNKTNIIIAVFCSVLIIEIAYIFFPSEFWGPIKLIDVINAIAQFATAGAFYLGFHQYHKNKTTERQTVLVNESKALIEKMQKTIEQVKTGDETEISNLSTCITKLANTATDFNAIFEALNEDIHKAVVRMHWQGMYFNSFLHVFKNINLGNILCSCGVSPPDYIGSLAYASEVTEREPRQLYPEYAMMKKIIETEAIHNTFNPKGKMESTFLFQHYFFDNNGLNDQLYGCMNIIDIRARAPALAILFEKLKLIGEV